ncbi:site-specific integrase [Natrinema versiforme]|uniref:Site-specific integrase n=1 Tax=Natrinema versiforme TaxID=88724 RepID=A0A4P8WHT9_9EURY|nr:site-specific integrase [Natrinema versiforme]QCS43017.1 site-specific integrase [Natrinema versiforme]
MVAIEEASSGRKKCWLNRDECKQLEQAAGRTDWQREIAIQFMTQCGLRSDEVPKVTLNDIRWSEEGDCWLFQVEGKNTDGGDPKMRDAWMPERVERNISKFTRERDRDEDESIISVSASSVRRWVREAAQDVAEETDNERWINVSSHDLRRSWANYHLTERENTVDARTMMNIGGWNSYNAIKPYLHAPTERRIGTAMAE